MPGSATTFDKLFQLICLILKPDSVFDLGAGAGKYGRLIQLLKEHHRVPIQRTVAVEVDSSYVSQYGLSQIYDEIMMKNLSSIIGDESIEGHTAILGDVIEHLPKSQGIDLLEFLMYQFNYLYIVTPIDMKQGYWQGKKQEMHISRWLEGDFLKYPNTSAVRRDGMLLAFVNGIETVREYQLEVAVNGGQVYVRAPNGDCITAL